jgi:hypothetical protein
MGDGRIIKREGVRRAASRLAVNAANDAVVASHSRLAGFSVNEPGAARSVDGARAPATADLPTTYCEQRLARSVWVPFGAAGVRNAARRRGGQEGDQAGVWLWQPTGGTRSRSCSTDERAEPARAGTTSVPPARDGRLIPSRHDDWRGDDRGRQTPRWGVQADRDASAPGAPGERRSARRTDGAGRPSPDALQMAVFAGISRLLVAPGGAPALLEVAPRPARTTRVGARPRSASTHRRADLTTLPAGQTTGTLPTWRPTDVGQRVVHHGRASVSDTSGRAGRSGSRQERDRREPGAPGGTESWDQLEDRAAAERAAPARAVRRSREGLDRWRLRRVPYASRRHADPTRPGDGRRHAARRGREASDRRAVQSAQAAQRDVRGATGCRGLERDSGLDSRIRRRWSPRVPSPSLLQHLEVVAGAGSTGTAWKSPTWRSTTPWTRTGAAPLTVRALVRRMMPVIVARSVPVSMAAGRLECMGGAA